MRPFPTSATASTFPPASATRSAATPPRKPTSSPPTAATASASIPTPPRTGVKGTINSTPSSLFYIDVYAPPASDADPTRRGEGRIYLGYTTAATDTTGNGLWGTSFTTIVPVGYIVSATATSEVGSTSEVSPDVVVIDQIPPTVSANFDVTLGPDHRVSFQFSENVNGSFGPSDVTLRNLTTGAVVPIHHTSYGLASNRADAFVSGILPDGNYRVTLNASGI